MIILIGHTKGGTGKTTIACNFAGLARAAGTDVVLADLDPRQGSARLWSQVREERDDVDDVPCVQLEGKVHKSLVDLEHRCELVIADAGGLDSVELRSAMVVADLLVAPTEVSMYSMAASEKLFEMIDTADAVREDSLLRLSLLNKVTAHSRAALAESQEGREVLKEFGFVPLDSRIANRKAIKRAEAMGLTVDEFKPRDASAAGEMRRAFKEVMQYVAGT